MEKKRYEVKVTLDAVKMEKTTANEASQYVGDPKRSH